MKCTNKKIVIGIVFLFIGLFSIHAEAASENAKTPLIEVKIVKGDTLSDFCISCFGNYNNALLKKLMALNPQISDPHLIYEGKTLIIPSECIKTPLKMYFTTKCPLVNYPPLSSWGINYFRWIDDDTVIVKGCLNPDADYRLSVYAPGDLEYEQENFQRAIDGTFRVKVFIGRKGKDYGKSFVLKLVNKHTGKVYRTIIRKCRADYPCAQKL